MTYQPGGPGEQSESAGDWSLAARPYAPGCCIGEGDAAGESWRTAGILLDTAPTVQSIWSYSGDGYGKVDDRGASDLPGMWVGREGGSVDHRQSGLWVNRKPEGLGGASR